MLADIRSVRYSAPGRPDGSFTASARMTKVKAATRGLRQYFAVQLASPDRSRSWLMFMDQRARTVRVVQTTGSEAERVIEPARSSALAAAGRNGRLSMSVSTEWLPVDRVRVLRAFTTYGEADDLVPFRTRLDMSGEHSIS